MLLVEGAFTIVKRTTLVARYNTQALHYPVANIVHVFHVIHMLLTLTIGN